jgi:hypothetical protein
VRNHIKTIRVDVNLRSQLSELVTFPAMEANSYCRALAACTEPTSGAYVFYSMGEVLYVGQSDNVVGRASGAWSAFGRNLRPIATHVALLPWHLFKKHAASGLKRRLANDDERMRTLRAMLQPRYHTGVLMDVPTMQDQVGGCTMETLFPNLTDLEQRINLSVEVGRARSISVQTEPVGFRVDGRDD